jgi:hypothetical protein
VSALGLQDSVLPVFKCLECYSVPERMVSWIFNLSPLRRLQVDACRGGHEVCRHGFVCVRTNDISWLMLFAHIHNQVHRRHHYLAQPHAHTHYSTQHLAQPPTLLHCLYNSIQCNPCHPLTTDAGTTAPATSSHPSSSPRRSVTPTACCTAPAMQPSLPLPQTATTLTPCTPPA